MPANEEAKDPVKALAEFLVNEAPEAVVVTNENPVPIIVPTADTAPTTVQPIADEKMLSLLADLKRIGIEAKNLHYLSFGKAFYGLHQLGDLIYNVESESDDLIEGYFMGERQIDPPRMEIVYRHAIEIPVAHPRDNNYDVTGLKRICLKTIHDIEEIKQSFPALSAGTNSVLDTISQKCLVAIGFLSKTEKNPIR